MLAGLTFGWKQGQKPPVQTTISVSQVRNNMNCITANNPQHASNHSRFWFSGEATLDFMEKIRWPNKLFQDVGLSGKRKAIIQHLV